MLLLKKEKRKKKVRSYFIIISKYLLKQLSWVGEMAQWLVITTGFVEVLGSVPSMHLAAHNCLELQFRGIQCCFLISVGPLHTCGIHTHIKKNNPPTHKIKISLLKIRSSSR